MLNSKQIEEIKEHLEKAGNPLFFFDNDADGLCSFLLLSRFLGRGKGVAIKSFPELDASYLRKINELKPDYVFILDKPLVAKEFLDECKKMNLPVVWIDHHDVKVDSEGINYYNPENHASPATYLCWQVTKKKEDLWIAVSGCIGDNFLPEFADEFAKEYPELWKEKAGSAFEILYETEIGKITRILDFALKDRTSNVVRMLRFMIKVKSPREILTDENNRILIRFNQINKKYQALIEKACQFANKGKLLFFQYGGDLSLSGEISNELSYKYPGKIIVVAFIKGAKANVSIRGRNVRDMTLKGIAGLVNATGGGHNDATGAKMNVEDLPIFKERIEKLIG